MNDITTLYNKLSKISTQFTESINYYLDDIDDTQYFNSFDNITTKPILTKSDRKWRKFTRNLLAKNKEDKRVSLSLFSK